MDVLFTIAMLGLMAVAVVVLGRGWQRSSRGGGYRAGRGYGAGEAPATGDLAPPVPEEDDAPWRWTRDDAAPVATGVGGPAPGGGTVQDEGTAQDEGVAQDGGAAR